ncbi:MAG: hypothetical protein ACI9ZH_002558 [Paracoccaceae bacterium]|jgi:hypothetical protein
MIVGDRAPPDGADGLQIGRRATPGALLTAAELVLSALLGILRTPAPSPRFLGPSVLALDRVYPCCTEIGADLATIVAAPEFRGEAAPHVPENGAQDDDHLSCVIGLRHWPAPGMERSGPRRHRNPGA